jgi:hypothetical protein
VCSAPTSPGLVSGYKVDPFLRFHTAQALLQEVALLESTVENLAKSRNERAYVVRLRVGVVPYARNQPYDVYSRLSFFLKRSDPDEELKANAEAIDREQPTIPVPAVRVVPVLATDNMEATDHSEAAQLLRQLGMAIGLMVQGNGANVGVQKASDLVKTASAKDYNSLLNITALTDNTLQARFGAARNGSGHYSMQERSQFITAVIFVPKKIVQRERERESERATQIDVSSQYDLRNPETGKIIPRLPNDKFYKDTLASLDGLKKIDETPDKLFKKRPEGCQWMSVKILRDRDKESNEEIGSESDRKEEGRLAFLFDLIGMIKANEDICFRKSVTKVDWDNFDWRFLWNKFAGLYAASEVSVSTFEIPERKLPEFAIEQTIMLVDDGNRTAGTVVAGKNVVPNLLHAWLETTDKEKARLVGTITPTSTAGQISVAFHSLSAMGLEGERFNLVLSDARAEDDPKPVKIPARIAVVKKPSITPGAAKPGG